MTPRGGNATASKWSNVSMLAGGGCLVISFENALKTFEMARFL